MASSRPPHVEPDPACIVQVRAAAEKAARPARHRRNWETGRHLPWCFRRADGQPWGLAGLWNTWTDPATGEIVESYTMLTMNADAHPLMNRMHRPDPTRGPDQQDKRSVVPIAFDDAEQWLRGSIADATSLVRLAPVACFDAAPAPG